MTVQHWHTTAIQALPSGWVNEHTTDIPGNVVRHPCPALLLQEHRATRRGQGTVALTAPYDTRAVFAAYDGAHLTAACDTPGYVRTLLLSSPYE